MEHLIKLMSVNTTEQDFHNSVSAKVRLVPEGVERYRVFTPFLFDDGDHLAVVMKKEGERWVLSDEAHTYMRLTDEINGGDSHGATQQKIVTNTLSMFQVEDRNGELVLEVPDGRYGDALYSFIQALLKVSDISYLSLEQV